MFLSWNAATTGFLSAPALSNSRVVMGIRKCHHSAPSHRVARRKWVKPQFRAKYPFKVCQRLFWSGNSRPAAGVEQRRWAEVFCWFLLWIRRQTRGPLAPPAALLYSSGLWSVSFLLLIWLLSVCVYVCVYVGWGGGDREWEMKWGVKSEKWMHLSAVTERIACHTVPPMTTVTRKSRHCYGRSLSRCHKSFLKGAQTPKFAQM